MNSKIEEKTEQSAALETAAKHLLLWLSPWLIAKSPNIETPRKPIMMTEAKKDFMSCSISKTERKIK